MLELASGSTRARVAPFGAELQSFEVDGRELLWQGGPAWPRRSPVLFPVVGRLGGDALVVGGRSYSLGQHGFARDRAWSVRESARDACVLELVDDAETRERFPLPFRLTSTHRVRPGRLDVQHVLSAPGPEPLVASLGAHPAFAWPLLPGAAKDAHVVRFAEDEPDPVRRLDDGLLAPEPHPTPVRGRELPLQEGLFAADALVLDRVRSRSLVYSGPGTPELHLSWEGYVHLGIWSRGDFLCLEPWHGHADPVGWAGELGDKPGVVHLQPGEERAFSWTVRVR